MFPMYLYTSVEFEANVRSRARTVSLGCLRYVVETYKHVDTLYRTDSQNNSIICKGCKSVGE